MACVAWDAEIQLHGMEEAGTGELGGVGLQDVSDLPHDSRGERCLRG